MGFGTFASGAAAMAENEGMDSGYEKLESEKKQSKKIAKKPDESEGILEETSGGMDEYEDEIEGVEIE